jgi:hypothetical protein
MLVRVKTFWVNPDMVVAVWHEHVSYSDTAYWRVTLRCEEGQVWQWKYETEEDAVRDADDIARQVNYIEPSVKQDPWPGIARQMLDVERPPDAR